MAEAAAIGRADEIKGSVIEVFIVPRQPAAFATPEAQATLKREVEEAIVRQVGSLARPAFVGLVHLLPKTRSGKIVRRAILAVAEGRNTGDLSTIEDANALDEIRKEVATAHPEGTAEETAEDV